MQNTHKPDTAKAGAAIQKTAPGTTGAATASHPSTVPEAAASPKKGVKSLIHESHKVGYKRDRPIAAAGTTLPSEPARK